MIEFSILGRSLRATGADPVLEAMFRSRLEFPEYAPPEYPFQIELEVMAQSPTDFPETAPSDQLQMLSGPMAIWNSDPIFWLGSSSTGGRIEMLEAAVKLDLWGSGDSRFEIAMMGLAEGLRASGLISLHTSMPARDGRALALLGPSGRGKTTSLIRALSSGLQPVCEDFAWCEPGTGSVYGFDRGLRLLPDTAKLFEQLFQLQASQIQGGEWQGDKWFVPYSSFTERQSATLAALVLLERQPELPTAWLEVAPRAAALALWEASGMPLSDLVRQRTSQEIGRLARTLPAYTLRLGRGEIDWNSGPLRIA